IRGVAAMRVVAIDLDRHFLAQLRPARAAMAAHRATLVVVDHHALADLRQSRADGAADRGDDTARLVPGDGRLAGWGEAAGLAAGFRAAVLVQVAAAHPRRLHLDDDLVRSRGRVVEIQQFELAIAGKHDTAHGFLLTPSEPARLSCRLVANA